MAELLVPVQKKQGSLVSTPMVPRGIYMHKGHAYLPPSTHSHYREATSLE
jgi:hypothetical protein